MKVYGQAALPDPAECVVCGTELPPAPARGGVRPTYCSRSCQQKAYRERIRTAADNGLRTEVVLVTPELAETWLTKNVKNRNLDSKLIKKYKASIIRGDWQLNGEPIIFGIASSEDADDAPLLDGQHRLRAVVLAGQAIMTLVVWGVPDEHQANMDIGKKRTVADALNLADLDNASQLGAAARLVWRYRTNQWDRSAAPTHQELIDMANDHLDDMAEAVRVGKRMTHATKLNPSAASAGFFVTADIDKDAAYEFAEQLTTGAELKTGSPALVLRNRVVTYRGKQHEYITAEDWFAFYVKAWNAFRSKQALKLLRQVRNEDFPTAK